MLATYQALRLAMVDATSTDPAVAADRTSFTIALNTARNQITPAAGIIAKATIDLIGGIGRAVLADRLPARRTRVSPRVVKSHLQTPRKRPGRPQQLPRHHQHRHPRRTRVDNRSGTLTTRHWA